MDRSTPKTHWLATVTVLLLAVTASHSPANAEARASQFAKPSPVGAAATRAPFLRVDSPFAPTLREEPLFVIPIGTAANDAPSGMCEDCDPGCGGGFAFLASADSVYFFDLQKNNLKCIHREAPNPFTISSLAGPIVTAQNEIPYDGCVGRDGAIYLIADRGTLKDRYVLYHLEGDQASRNWVRAYFDDDSLAWKTVGAHRIPMHHNLRLAPAEHDEIAVYDFNPVNGRSLVVARGGLLLPPRDRRRIPAGLHLRSGAILRRDGRGPVMLLRAAGRPSAALREPGYLIGADEKDNLYFLVFRRNNLSYLAKEDSEGGVLAAVPLPLRENTAPLLGKGEYQVTPRGELIEVRLTMRGLVASRWTSANREP